MSQLPFSKYDAEFRKDHPETIGETDKTFDLSNYCEWLEKRVADRDALRAELERTKGELERVRGLLMVALPHVEASAGAQHLMDGFRPRKRPLDDAVEEIRAALERKGEP